MDTINKFPQQERSEQQDLLRDLPQQNRELPQADRQKHLDQDHSLKVDSLRSKSLKASETDGNTPIITWRFSILLQRILRFLLLTPPAEKKDDSNTIALTANKLTVKELTVKKSTVKKSTAKESTAKELTAENRAAGKNDESKTPKPVIRLIHIGKKWEKNDLQRGYEDHSHPASEPLRFWIDLGETTDRYNQLAKKMEKYHKACSRAHIIVYVPEDDLDLAPKIIHSIWGSSDERVINDSPWDIDTLLNYKLQER